MSEHIDFSTAVHAIVDVLEQERIKRDISCHHLDRYASVGNGNWRQYKLHINMPVSMRLWSYCNALGYKVYVQTNRGREVIVDDCKEPKELEKKMFDLMYSEMEKHGYSTSYLERCAGISKGGIWKMKRAKNGVKIETLAKVFYTLGYELGVMPISRKRVGYQGI